jgi:hypothetical protein
VTGHQLSAWELTLDPAAARVDLGQGACTLETGGTLEDGAVEYGGIASGGRELVVTDFAGVAMTELPGGSVVQAADRAGGQQRARMLLAGRDLHDATAHVDVAGRGGCLVIPDVAGVAVAELAIGSVAPAAPSEELCAVDLPATGVRCAPAPVESARHNRQMSICAGRSASDDDQMDTCGGRSASDDDQMGTCGGRSASDDDQMGTCGGRSASDDDQMGTCAWQKCI